MRLKISVLILAFLAVTLILGCTQSYIPGVYNEYCPASYLHPGEIQTAGIQILPRQTIELRAGTQFAPQPANYAFQSAVIYYNDKLNDIHLFFSVQRNQKGLLTATLNCASGSGLLPNMKSFASVPIWFVS